MYIYIGALSYIQNSVFYYYFFRSCNLLPFFISKNPKTKHGARSKFCKERLVLFGIRHVLLRGLVSRDQHNIILILAIYLVPPKIYHHT